MISKLISEPSIQALRQLLQPAQDIVITCHVRPDGDAIGSTLGLWHMLRQMGKRPVVVTPDQPPRSLTFLPGFKDIAPYTRYTDYTRRLLADADLIFCCDFNQPSRVDMLEQDLMSSPAPKVLIDHHRKPDDFAQVTFSYPGMSSTCELLFRILAAMGLYTSMSRDAAECILTGIITDTRNFSVNCNNIDLYLILVKLLEKGLDKQKIVREALETKSLDSVKLQAYAISSRMEILSKHRAAIITLSREDLDNFHYERGDTEGLVNAPLEIRGITSSFFLREDPDCIKVSARSQEDFPVSLVCEQLYGGGGHLMAAGGEFHGTLDECRRILIEALPQYDQYLK